MKDSGFIKQRFLPLRDESSSLNVGPDTINSLNKSDVGFEPVVFYDGECGLCDRFVQKLIKLDRSERIRFATLQGETARKLLGNQLAGPDLTTMRLVDDKGVHVKSDAAILSLGHLGGLWKAAKILMLIPAALRNWWYDLAARNRYRLFGKADTCMLPTPTLRKRFLP